ncbi:hypothetical protein CEXT_660111, partial [Caerostris extrusa]
FDFWRDVEALPAICQDAPPADGTVGLNNVFKNVKQDVEVTNK